jgi:hypothetical protein
MMKSLATTGPGGIVVHCGVGLGDVAVGDDGVEGATDVSRIGDIEGVLSMS